MIFASCRSWLQSYYLSAKKSEISKQGGYGWPVWIMRTNSATRGLTAVVEVLICFAVAPARQACKICKLEEDIGLYFPNNPHLGSSKSEYTLAL